MKFNRLRLVGFKTFVEPTDLLIEPGLTGVVGPNGCGKSNLVEALRWVMGESSHKAFRANDMDDVIFSGTTGRPSRNMAEVSLQLDNGDRTAPAGFNDNDLIEVARRIDRGQGSHYRINGRDVRARDVNMLFADASTGARSPALVRQGQIGEIVGAKPAARRRILEEAAGVAGLHARRHEAETRLKAAETNLLRLEDVITQLAAQVDGLRRQSKQAVRYRTLAAEIRKYEATLLWLRWSEVVRTLAEAERAVEVGVRDAAECTRAQAEAARLQAIAAHALPPLRQKEAEAAATLQRLTLARGELDKEEARLATRRQDLERRHAQLTQDLERETALSADAEGVLERLAQEEETLQYDQEAAAEAEVEAEAILEGAQEALTIAEDDLDEKTRHFADSGARRATLEQTVRELKQRLLRTEAERVSVTAEERRLQLDAGTADLEARRAEAEIARERLAHAEDAAAEAEAAHQAARRAVDEVRPAVTEAERTFSKLDTEVKTLTKLLQSSDSRFPPVADLLTVTKGFEMALGAALGDDLDLPVAPEAPARWAGSTPSADDPALPAGAAPLAAQVSGAPALVRSLNQVGIVEATEGARLQGQLKPGQRLVSRAGDLWRWDGVVAAADAPTAAARRLAERNRLADLEADAELAREAVEEARDVLDLREGELRVAASAETQTRETRRTAQRAAETARELEAAAERKASAHIARLSALTEARERLVASKEEAEERLIETEAAIALLEAPVLIDATLATARGVVAQTRAASSEARSRLDGLARERAQRQRRLEAIAGERRSWAGRAGGAGERLAAIEARRSEAETELAHSDDMPAQLLHQRRNLLSQIEQAEAGRREAADRLVEGESALAAADRAARDALEAMSGAREESARAEARLEAAVQRRDDVMREIADTLEGPPETAREHAELVDDGKTPDISAIETSLERAKRERERLGAVNLRAEIELTESETQHDELVRERDDLNEAIRRLRSGIASLNREARERLQASFAVVDGHFRKLFDTLFGGGEAQLVLTDAEDPLEAGLDIIAKPPGKKPQTLSLLSGGEQALTAMALIFAVFLTNPAPICVLDEVDAPLDDSNVERFCALMDEMTRLTDTRFLVITHNPISMAHMDRLFGVTMAERGVSRLVSVDLQSAERLREVS
ncbi:chromosome partition protein Smc [Azorhizobium oxalatiphilum]|uniref:Chromosome partition protein Smc n=1 Tax=Azorhizobium oxalatiphilum TaxID=980631 RepID=A0A917BJT4_9HYPH|nr:chromosome segregation protein SMC [Azorhizobium oxalatiphilum]GGF45423.1 chromosome partition protein Smc [Azorhizobium oxalatiphilum]